MDGVKRMETKVLPSPPYREAILQKPLANGWVQCTACHHWCARAPEGVGKCGVRQNIDGRLYLRVWGKAAAIHVDPVEKKPLFHFLPRGEVLSLGTVGCNFFCSFCQNWQISQAREFRVLPDGETVPQTGTDWLPQQVVEAARQRGIPMIAYTYNEPTVWFEYTYDIARLAHEAGLRNIYVSTGYETHEAMDTIAPYLDAINIDLKGFSERFYRDVCGTRLAPVLDTIRYIGSRYRERIWMEVTTLLIGGENDSPEEIRAMARFLREVGEDIPWHLTAAHPDYRMREMQPTSRRFLEEAHVIAREEGLHHVYVGNVHDRHRESTYCPSCGEPVIERDWYQVEERWSRRGFCPRCGAAIAGVWT